MYAKFILLQIVMHKSRNVRQNKISYFHNESPITVCLDYNKRLVFQ